MLGRVKAAENISGRGYTFCLRMSVIILLLLISEIAKAQEVDYDYRAYKFYAEEESELLLPDTDSVTLSTLTADAFRVYDRNISNTHYSTGFHSRGLPNNEERYTLGNLTLSRTTAQNLLALGTWSEKYEGVGGRVLSGSALSTTELLVGRERGYHSKRHYLRAEFSGRNYIGGISYRATWQPKRNGVRTEGDWVINHNIRLRTGRDIYVDGVYTNALDCGIEASRYTRRSSISMAATLSYSDRGLRQSSTEETFSLLNNPLYNPTWGMQNGKVRNSRTANTLRPDIVALWDYRLTAWTTLCIATNIGYESRGMTSLAWFDAMTPMPDNYRYLPSYQTDDAQQAEVTEAWMSNNLKYTQIDWEGLYHTNLIQTDGHSRYAVVERRENTLHTALAASVNSEIGSLNISGGIKILYDATRNFKVMDDLLGGNHIIDCDYYLINDATYSNQLQNNLLNPNNKITEDDRFGYDYCITQLGISLFGMASWRYDGGVVDGAIEITTTGTHRHGFYEKELFRGNGSYGRSRTIKMLPYRIAANWQHIIDNHRLGAAFMLRNETPESEDMFLQTEYNNRTISDIQLATTVAGELNYGFTLANRLTLSTTLFITSALNGCDVLHYYDDLAGEYVDTVVSNIDTTTGGIEIKASAEWTRHLSSTFMFSALASRYSDSAKVMLYADTDNRHLATTASRISGCRTSAPELSAYGDIAFRHGGWTARASLYYSGQRYVTPSFVRRSDRVTGQALSDAQYTALMSQQHLGDIFGIDLSISKWINFEKSALGIQFSIRNLLGSSNIIGGYEQNRIRRVTIPNGTILEPFDARMTYGYPRLFYLSLALRFE